jgi:hypothetical protein
MYLYLSYTQLSRGCSKEEFEKFIAILGENSGRSLREWSNQVSRLYCINHKEGKGAF